MSRGPSMAEKRARFVEIASACKTSFTQAALMAGYPAGSQEMSRLLSDPQVVAEILRLMQPKIVKFQALNAKSFEALDYILSPDNWKAIGNTRTGIPVYEVTARDRVAAALGWLKIVSEVNPDSLQEKARGADARETLRELADRVVTENYPVIEGREAPVQIGGQVTVIDVDAVLTEPTAAPEPDTAYDPNVAELLEPEQDPEPIQAPSFGPEPMDPTGTDSE